MVRQLEIGNMPEAEDRVGASRLIRRRLPPGAALLIAVLSLPGPAAAEVLEQDKGEAPAGAGLFSE